MKLLVITQVIDKNDPVLGFFHRWVSEFSKKVDSVSVICLKQGVTSLPANVKVYSLGKEKKESRFLYVKNFFRYITSLKSEYDAVLVHMNQEYVLLGGLLWKLLGKRVYMWRNHHAGNLLTDIAAAFCTKVFCTSKFSFTAKYKKTVLMPVGIDTHFFRKQTDVVRKPASILFLGRIAPVKKPHVLLEALKAISNKGISFNASFYGDPLPKDKEYLENLKKKSKDWGLSDKVTFFAGIPNDATPKVYSEHEIFVNLSSSGMYDKTIFEAAACESMILASNENLRTLVDDSLICNAETQDVANKLELLLARKDKDAAGKSLRAITEAHHSLEKLAERLIVSMQ